MRIAVIDGQGAGLGKTIIKRIKKEFGNDVYIVALGTNSIATSNMVRSGANVGITGEESICHFCKSQKPDAIIGPMGIIASGGINGEITCNISKAVFTMECTKYIIPLKSHGIYIPFTTDKDIKEFVDEIIKELR